LQHLETRENLGETAGSHFESVSKEAFYGFFDLLCKFFVIILQWQTL
jgi:hypothetical protein